MGTKSGGEFFGKVGLFDEGYEFDACVLDDNKYLNNREFSIPQRIERMTYLEGKEVIAKFVKGEICF